MKTVAGVFRLYQMARDAAGALRRSGFSENQVNLLSPASSEDKIHTIPTSGTEQPGVGGAIGGLLGGALGVAGGLELGMAAAVLIPGVGPVLAFGLAGAALLGAGGAVGGAALGNAADDNSNEGVPSDEIFFYEDALRQGRSVVLVLAGDDSEEQRAHKLLADAGAESLDAARKDWWLGLRDAEQEHYRALGDNFELDEDVYRDGFSSALRRECRGRSSDEEADCLKWWYPDVWDSQPFRRGYERGRKDWQMQETGEALSVGRTRPGRAVRPRSAWTGDRPPQPVRHRRSAGRRSWRGGGLRLGSMPGWALTCRCDLLGQCGRAGDRTWARRRPLGVAACWVRRGGGHASSVARPAWPGYREEPRCDPDGWPAGSGFARIAGPRGAPGIAR